MMLWMVKDPKEEPGVSILECMQWMVMYTQRCVMLSLHLLAAVFIVHVRRPGVILLQSKMDKKPFLAIKDNKLTYVRRFLRHTQCIHCMCLYIQS